MSSLQFLKDESWDFPFFKKLAANDTGASSGHQGGMVIPKDLRIFFPNLTGQPTSEQPTIDQHIKAILIVNGQKVGAITTRYQIQSWGGTRRPESRLTSNLTSLLNQARADDYIVIQRSLENLDLYRLWLISQGSPSYNDFAQLAGNKRWGTIQKDIPMTQEDINRAAIELNQSEEKPFSLFEEEPKHRETRSRRIARSIIFRATIQALYDCTCSVCRIGLSSPKGVFEVIAAHIVPKSKQGSDDVRNGLALCRTHHWAFDNGLFAIDQNRRILVPEVVCQIDRNEILAEFNGQPIKEANDSNLLADLSAFEWHRDNILLIENG